MGSGVKVVADARAAAAAAAAAAYLAAKGRAEDAPVPVMGVRASGPVADLAALVAANHALAPSLGAAAAVVEVPVEALERLMAVAWRLPALP